MKHVDVLNEGKKVARLVANRDLDPKNVKQKKRIFEEVRGINTCCYCKWE